MWEKYIEILKNQTVIIENLLKTNTTKEVVELGVCSLTMFSLLDQINLIKDEAGKVKFWQEIEEDVKNVVNLTNEFLNELGSVAS